MTAAGHGIYGWMGKAARPAAFAIVFVAALALATNFANPFSMDFVSYWAAGALTLNGTPAASYDLAVHRAVELQVTGLAGQMPFPYAPPYLLLAAPFALLPFPVAAVAWVVATFAFYLQAVRRLAPEGGWIAAAFPPALTTAIIGQNAFLTCGLMASGMALLAKRPFVAGLLLGCLILKPQLGLVLPFVLFAGGEWRAIAGAAAASIGLLLLGAIAFGIEPYRAWLEQAPLYASIVTEGSSGWQRMASVYAALRLAGLGDPAAGLAHVAVALAATGAACLVWRRSRDIGARAGSLAAATALASPYLYGYDTLILILPFLWLADRGEDRRALALVWMLSFAGFLQNWGGGVTPNLAPLAAIVLLVMVCRRAFGLGAPAGPVSAPLAA